MRRATALSTLDDLENHWQLVRSAILAPAGLLVSTGAGDIWQNVSRFF